MNCSSTCSCKSCTKAFNERIGLYIEFDNWVKALIKIAKEQADAQ